MESSDQKYSLNYLLKTKWRYFLFVTSPFFFFFFCLLISSYLKKTLNNKNKHLLGE